MPFVRYDRRLPRLSGFDYHQEGYYFVTFCTQNRKNLLSSVSVGNGLDRSTTVCHTRIGEFVAQSLEKLPEHFDAVRVDKYVVMPNHVHAIIVLGCLDEPADSPIPSLSTVIGQVKSGVSRRAGFPVWQKSFHDHVIRNEQDYLEIWNYIDLNPQKWELDCFYCSD